MHSPQLQLDKAARKESDIALTSIMTRITDASPRDLVQVRFIIEPQAAAAAALHAREMDLDAIGGAHDRATAAKIPEEFENWDSEFHKLIFASTRNEFLVNLHDILRVIRARNPWIEIKRRTFSEERRLSYCQDHFAIFSALKSRDPKAASDAMTAHMAAISRNLFGLDVGI